MTELTIRLDPETIEEIAAAVAGRLQSVTPVDSNTHRTQSDPVSPAKDDPWANDSDPWAAQTHAAPAAQMEPAPSATSAPAPADQGSASAPTESPEASAPPQCKHGEMVRRPAGVARSGPREGQPYGPFWACPAPRGAPDKCKPIFQNG